MIISEEEYKNSIRNKLSESNYEDAVIIFNQYLDTIPYYSNRKELIYLKRLGNIPVTGRDIVYFYPYLKTNQFLSEHLSEYIDLLDLELSSYTVNTLTLIEFISSRVPTFEELKRKVINKYDTGVSIFNGNVKRDKYELIDSFFNEKFLWCINGLILKIYPDPIRYCRSLVEDPDRYYKSLWVKYPPFFLEQLYAQGLHVNHIDLYYLNAWRGPSLKFRGLDFTTATRMLDLEYDKYFPTATIDSVDFGQINYTGRSHIIESDQFFEVDVYSSGAIYGKKIIDNPFLNSIYEIFRNSENRLRNQYGIKNIGEGWISEMLLLNLVKEHFSDTLHHYSPKWLSPQHLDMFIPSLKIAIEYQGKQHFEPVSFFGGQAGFESNLMRDKKKLEKCKKNGVKLITWNYGEPISEEMLMLKILKTSN